MDKPIITTVLLQQMSILDRFIKNKATLNK